MATKCAAWPEETGVTSEFIKSHYIPVKGSFNFSGIPIALTYIPAYLYSFARSDNLLETFTRTRFVTGSKHGRDNYDFNGKFLAIDLVVLVVETNRPCYSMFLTIIQIA